MSAHLKPPVNEKDHVAGAATAAIELVEFGDYQCPHCGAAHPIIKKIQQDFGGQIRFIFRNFPLSEIHPQAMAAALATEAAGLQDKFWAMHDIIFEHQSQLNEAGLHKLAASAGLDANLFNQDRQRAELQEKVDTDFESGVRSGVNGTPSFFINGTKFDGGATDLYNMLRESVDSR